MVNTFQIGLLPTSSFFKELEEAAAYIKNQEMIKNAEDTIQKLYNKRLDIELALRIQNAFPEY